MSTSTTIQSSGSNLEPVNRMTRDIATAAKDLSDEEARYLVAQYYTMQEDRKRAANQGLALVKQEKPCLVIDWLANQSSTLEKQIKRALEVYTDNHAVGGWMKSIYGIGPVLSAGLLAHIDITKAPTAGHIWRFAGLDPTVKWSNVAETGKWVQEFFGNEPPDRLYGHAASHFGRSAKTLRRYAESDRTGNAQKLTVSSMTKAISRRPWNADLKTLCWKVGQSFMKFSNHEDCYYGHIYRERKAFEIKRNGSGENRELALVLAERVGTGTEAYGHYSMGMLPPAQIDARARRYAVKLFLSHLQMVWFKEHFHRDPPLPYPIAIGGHAHFIQPPMRSGTNQPDGA